jgi:molybdate transport system permease protein
MIAGYLPGQTATVATAVYAAVESGDGALARGLVMATSILALMAVWAAGRFAPPRSA